MADMCGGDHAGAGGAAGVLLPVLLLPVEHGPAVVPDRGGIAGEGGAQEKGKSGIR